MLQRAFPQANWPDPVEGFAPALPLNPGYSWAGGGLIVFGFVQEPWKSSVSRPIVKGCIFETIRIHFYCSFGGEC